MSGLGTPQLQFAFRTLCAVPSVQDHTTIANMTDSVMSAKQVKAISAYPSVTTAIVHISQIVKIVSFT